MESTTSTANSNIANSTNIHPDLLQPGRRLMISRMELENFKSYAGVQSIGPFHKCFSSIVGPNGSGKSNVIDALLFVFGYRANKLRLNKVSELIHKSHDFPALEYARVSIYFQVITDQEDSEDDYEVVSGSEFAISRVAYVNNSSKYMINSKTATYSEIGSLLRSYAIDLDNNRFLILQGEVEQIAMMKPKALTPHEEGLLEYLEDIIGSNKFLPMIEEANKKLEEVNEQRLEKVQRLKTAERERDNLLDSKTEVELFLAKERDIRLKKNALYQLFLSMENKNEDKIVSRQTEIVQKLAYEKEKMKTIESNMVGIEKDYEAVKKQYDGLEKDLQNATTQFDSLERKDVKLQEDLKHARANLKKAQTNQSKDAKKVEESTAELETITSQITKYRTTLNDFENKKRDEEAELSKLMDSLEGATAPLRAELEKEKLLLASEEKAVASLTAERDLIINAIQLIESRSAEVTKALRTQEEKLAKLRTERDGVARELAAAEGGSDGGVAKEIKSIEKRLAAAKAEEEAAQSAVRETRSLVETLRARLSALDEREREEREESQSESTGKRILKALQQAASTATSGLSGKVAKGLRGRLGDLGSIPSDYQRAISVAAGNVLDHIVVEREEEATACVEFLRKMNLGRASFLILSQILSNTKVSDVAAARGVPAGTSRLVDLIEDIAGEDIKVAFYWALRDTLVASDLDTAVKVAYEGDRVKHRVVTVEGELIEASGAMTGGGNNPAAAAASGKGKASSIAAASFAKVPLSSSSAMRVKGQICSAVLAGKKTAPKSTIAEEREAIKKELVAAETSLASAEKTLATLRDEIVQLESNINSNAAKSQSKAVAGQKLSLRLSQLDHSVSSLTEKLVTLQGDVALTAEEEAERSARSQELARVEENIAKASPELKSLQLKVTRISREIMSVGGMGVTKTTARIDSLSHQVESLSSALAGKTIEEETLKKTLSKLSSSLEKSNSEIAKLSERIKQLETEEADMVTDIRTIEEAMASTKSRLSELESTLLTKQSEYKRVKEEIASIKSVEVDLALELERVNAEAKELSKTKTHWESELAAIRELHKAEQMEMNDTVNEIHKSFALPKDGDAMEIDEDAPSNTVDELPIFSEEDLQFMKSEEIKREINLLETERNRLKSNVNMNALYDYLRKEMSYRQKLRDLEVTNTLRNQYRTEFEHLRRLRLETFMSGFATISAKLKEMYQMITLGGDAELELVDSLDPFSEGIAFSVRPPKKSWKQIGNLSGGEKTLSSLALVFALHYYKPTPLYVMDEIDAALDFKNVSIVANYIKERTKNAQFIIISLRNNMFELADRLVGIYKTNDTTKSVTINPKSFQQNASVAAPSNENTTTAASGEMKGRTNGLANHQQKEQQSLPLGDATNRYLK